MPRPLLRRDWRPALRWFAAEFLVVVTGVLVALALNAWWEGRQDVARERAYLRQLAADLETNEDLARRAQQAMEARLAAGERLLVALRDPAATPPDSLDAWLLGVIGVFPLYPRMGTVQALIETGDLNLIRDDGLRAALVDYAAVVQTGSEMVDAVQGFALEALGAIHRRVDYPALSAGGTVHTAADWARLAADPELRGSISAILVGHRNRTRSAAQILESTTALRRRVEAALGDRGGPGGAATRAAVEAQP